MPMIDPPIYWLATTPGEPPFHAVPVGTQRAACGRRGPWARCADDEDADLLAPTEDAACPDCWRFTEPEAGVPA